MIEIFGFDKVAKRFWPKVCVREKCWEWIASKNTDGYGLLMCRNKAAGFPRKLLRAHTVSWEIHFGAIPKGMHVLHTCDNPGCVNPGHLFLGTHQDNMRDMKEKGRAPGASSPGDKHPRAILSSEVVKSLRDRHSKGERIVALARDTGYRYATVWAAVRGVNW